MHERIADYRAMPTRGRALCNALDRRWVISITFFASFTSSRPAHSRALVINHHHKPVML
jgi:hypothetical protein